MPRGHKVLSCAQETLRPLRNARSRSRNIKSEVLGSGAVMSRKMAMPNQTRRISALLRSAAALGPFLTRAGESLDTPPGAVGFFGLTMPELFGSGLVVLPRCRADTSLSLTAIPSRIHRISSDLRS